MTATKRVFTLLPPDEIRTEIPNRLIAGFVGNGEIISVDNFTPNPAFVEFLHQVIEKHAPDAEPLQESAAAQGEGWIYMVDGRTPTPQGDVSSEDIFGGFQIKEGKVLDGSYKQNPEHILMTEHGMFQLETWLLEIVLTEMRQFIKSADH